MKNTSACALDCYDACSIMMEEGKIKADPTNPIGNGALCAIVNKNMSEEARIEVPRIEGKEVSLDEAMQAVHQAMKADKTLLWKGSGNMAVMQNITALLIEKLGGSLTHGSLCDGAGDAGILNGRGVNRNLPLSQIEKAETVVVWGRNVTVTNSHLMPYLEGKTLVVIDPVKTAIAKKAEIHLQIKPRSDYYLAIMLSRFVYMEDSQATQWLEEFAPEYEEFYDFTQEYRIKPILEYIGTDLGELGHLLNAIRDKKTVFLLGAGIQKYSTGASVFHAIDSLAALLGLFGKEGSGVSYLSTMRLGFDDPFAVKCDTVPKALADFSAFDTVLVQGGNPAESMPDTARVEASLEGVENLIYFGLYENETSKRAKIVIPAKHFYEKEDLLLSYGHQYVRQMHTLKASNIGISEYDFTKYLFDAFGFEGLESEESYINTWLEQCSKEGDDYISPAHQEIPYLEGFGEEGEDEFEFIEDYEDDFVNTKSFTKVRTSAKNKMHDERFWLLSPKSKHALNTQFKRENTLEIHSTHGYEQGERLNVTSDTGSIVLEVQLNDDLRQDSVLIYASTPQLNYLTPAILSEEGDNACFQELKISLSKVYEN